MTNVHTVFAKTADSSAAGELSDAIRVRIGANLVERLDRIEAIARGNGMRAVTRSTLIRTAVEEYVGAIEEELSLPPTGGAR